MNTEIKKPSWGLAWLIPDEAETSWGARAIFTNGCVDIVYQDSVGEQSQRLAELMNDGPLEKACEKASDLYDEYEITPDSSNDVTLYEDDSLVIRADTNASYGYLYMAAWLK